MVDYHRFYCIPARLFAEITYLFPHSGPATVEERRARVGAIHTIVSTGLYAVAGYLAFASVPVLRGAVPSTHIPSLASSAPSSVAVVNPPEPAQPLSTAGIMQDAPPFVPPPAQAVAPPVGKTVSRAASHRKRFHNGVAEDDMDGPGDLPSIRDVRCRTVADGDGADGRHHTISVCD